MSLFSSLFWLLVMSKDILLCYYISNNLRILDIYEHTSKQYYYYFCDFFDVYTTMAALYLHIQYTHIHARTHNVHEYIRTHVRTTCTTYTKLATHMYTISYCLYVRTYVHTVLCFVKLCYRLANICEHFANICLHTTTQCSV